MYLFIILTTILSCNDKSVQDLIRNFESNKEEILALKEFYSQLVPEGFIVRVRFDSKNEIDLFVHEPTEVEGKRELLFQQWNMNFRNYKPEIERSEYDIKYNGKTNSLDKVKEELNWTNETFEMLYKKLKAVSCIGISNRSPIEIEYGFSGMGVYSYLVFDEDLTNKKQAEYSDGCTMKFYKDNIVLVYGSGAVGSLCTPEFENKVEAGIQP